LNQHDFFAGRDDVEHRHDVAVMDLRSDARFVQEHRHELGILGELRVQSLRRDDAREAFVADQSRDVDRRHAAARDLPVQEVAADLDRRLATRVRRAECLGCLGHGLRASLRPASPTRGFERQLEKNSDQPHRWSLSQPLDVSLKGQRRPHPPVRQR
jgi:hypothetical protein